MADCKIVLVTGGAARAGGDVRDSKVTDICVGEVDAVFHLAAVTSVPLSVEDPVLTYETNVNGTSGLLNSSVRAGVEKFIFVSSCARASKLQGERLCLDFQDRNGLKTMIFQLFNVYGPRQVANGYSGVMARFVDRARQGLPLIVYGDGSQTRDFVHVWDVVDAFLRVLADDNADGQVFNIGSGKPVSVNELAKYVLERALG